MTKKSINPLLKTILELGPIILFFIVYMRIKDMEFIFFDEVYQGFIVATAGFIPGLLLCTGILWYISGRLSIMQLFTAILVVVMGGLGIWFNDEKFFKMKPTIVYLIFSAILAFGLLYNKSYLKLLMGNSIPINNVGWIKLTQRFCTLFFCLAIMNELVWRFMSTEAWVNFKTFGMTGFLFIFVLSQTILLKKYTLKDNI